MTESSYKFRAGNLYPIIEIILDKDGTKLRTDALVDSGATISVFQGSIAEYLGIKTEEGESRIFQGIGGKIVGYVHTVILRAGKVKFPCKIAFSNELTTSVNILGRIDFFERFLVIFDEANKKLKLDYKRK